MKKNTIKNRLQKMIITMSIVIIATFSIVPTRTYAADWDLGGALLKEIVQLIASVGDIAMGLLNTTMLGAKDVGSSMLSKDDANLKDPSSWLYDDGSSGNYREFANDELNTNFLPFADANFAIPNMLYSPENIFANNIAALDVNFLRPNTFNAITNSDEANDKSKSAASNLREIIASWYKSFRNIAIVGLLSVLIYLGIRILISSTADDKARYKESIKNWVVALCLVFVIHFIMSGILMLTDKVTDLFNTTATNGINVKVNTDNTATYFKTNLTGYVRLRGQSADWQTSAAYIVVYLVLVIYTYRFTFLYFKRFLYTAFFTMIAPLVALTYPIDKAGDGKSQAFNMWFKEYTMNVIIQPIHLILYTVFVGAASDLAVSNPLYAIVAIGFLIPAEKFIKKMFGLDQAQSTDGFGSFAGGAVAMTALNQAKKLIGGSSKKGGSSSKGDSSNNEERSSRIWANKRPELGAFAGGEQGNPKTASQVGNALGDRVGVAYNADMTNSTEKDESMRAEEMLGEQPLTETQNMQSTSLGMEATEASINDSFNSQKDSDISKTKKVIAGVKTAGKMANKAVRYTGPKLGRAAMAGAGLIAGTTVGIASGVATGSPSNVVQYGLTGAGTGAGIGVGVASGVASLPGAVSSARGVASSGIEDVRTTYEKNAYGEAYAREQERLREATRQRERFMKDKDTQDRYKAMKKDLGYNGDVEELMGAAFDLQEAGVTNLDMQRDALNLEMNRDNGRVGGHSHEKVVDVASFASNNGFGKEYIEDAKKRESMEQVVQSMVPDKKAQEEVMMTFAELHGRRELYKNVINEKNKPKRNIMSKPR